MPFTGPIEDRLAIRELLDIYGDAVTRNDATAWASTWAEDASWSIPFYPRIGTVRGRDKIVATWVNAMKVFDGDVFVVHPGSIVVDGDTAKVTAYTSEVYDIDGVVIRDRGVYDDVCVKEDGRWLFKSRVFNLLHRAAAPVTSSVVSMSRTISRRDARC